MGALELHILLGEFVAVDFKRSRFTMKWNESESEVVYSDPAIDMSQSNGCLFWSSDLLPTTYYVPPTTYDLRPTTYYLLPTTYDLRPMTYDLRPTTYYLLRTTYYLLPTTCDL